MTVAELIAWLGTQPADRLVFHTTYDRDGAYEFTPPTPTVDLVLLLGDIGMSGVGHPDAIEAVVL